jgi:E3 ubiquitin-protein ligase RNF38/44
MIAITILFFVLLGVAAILLLIPTAALHRHSTPSSNPPKGLPLKDLKKLPRFRFSTKTTPETAADQSSCVVCLEDIKQGQWCRNLVGCGHVLHMKCVDSWLVKVSACPICRTRVEFDQGVKDRPSWDFVWKNELNIGRIFSFFF